MLPAILQDWSFRWPLRFSRRAVFRVPRLRPSQQQSLSSYAAILLLAPLLPPLIVACLPKILWCTHAKLPFMLMSVLWAATKQLFWAMLWPRLRAYLLALLPSLLLTACYSAYRCWIGCQVRCMVGWLRFGGYGLHMVKCWPSDA
jgi:hypothetical protein